MKRLLALALVFTACGATSDRLLVGAGTTLVDSGFIDALAVEYELASGIGVLVLGESSQRLFDLGRRGEVDVLLTHDRWGLDEFIGDGYAAASADVLVSTFLLVGAPEVVATLRSTDAAAVFAEIAERQLPFVSRADGSGTYRQELAFWDMAGVDPVGQEWYDTTGQGMGLTMQVADQRSAFVVVEEGAWLEASPHLGLVVVPLSGTFPNIYTATVVAEGTGEEFFAWLLSADGTSAISRVNDRLFGQVVYRAVGT